MRPTQTPARSSRLAGAAGALLLQGGFLLMFLASMPALRPPPELGHELNLILPRLRPPSSSPQRPQGVPGPVTVTPPLFLAPPNIPSNALTRPILPAAPGIATFGQALNGCAPEKYSSLPPDQQARCPRPGEGMAIQEAPNLMGSPSHVKDEAHWANTFAHERSPLLLPGASQNGFGISVGIDSDGKGTGLAAQGAFNSPENFPLYDIKQYGRGDFYKIEQAYDAWNKEHPDKVVQR